MERYCIDHKTVYDYGSPVSVAQQLVRLQPRALPWQCCLSFSLQADPPPQEALPEYDYFGNRMQSLGFAGAHRQLMLLARSVVDVGLRPWARIGMDDSPAWELARDVLAGSEQAQLAEYRFFSPLVPRFMPATEFARSSFSPGRPLLEACFDLMLRLHAAFDYAPGASDSSSTVQQLWDSGKGVCQDFAHFMLAALRGLGLAARYVSGYLCTQPPPGQERLVGSDASHAWVALWCPRWGWVEFDPTNRRLADIDYIVLGWGRDFGDVSPVRGVITGASGHGLKVEVSVWPQSELSRRSRVPASS